MCSKNKEYLIYFMWGIIVVMSALFVSCNTDDYSEPEKTEIEDNNDDSDPSDDEEDNDNPNGSYHEGENLLGNGGLEKWTSYGTIKVPNQWSLPSNEYVNQNWKIIIEGKSSAKMQSKKKGETARLEQCIQIAPQVKIRIRFHYYVEQWKDKGARTYCYFRTRSAEVSTISIEELRSFYDKNTYYIIRGGGYGLMYLPHDLNVWQVFDETIEVPPTATYFVFGVNSYYGTTIYVDDCSVAKIEYW